MKSANKSPRAYGLFEKVDGKWVRIYPDVFGRKEVMVRLCQNALLAYFLGTCEHPRELRPIGNLAQCQAERWARMETKAS